MNKRDKIKQEYGIYYDEISFYIDEDGWTEIMNMQETEVQLDFELKNKYENGIRYDYARPKLLKGLENNNGWIKIDETNDCFELGINCHFILRSGVTGIFVNLDNSQYLILKNRATHYKIIETPKPPLY